MSNAPSVESPLAIASQVAGMTGPDAKQALVGAVNHGAMLEQKLQETRGWVERHMPKHCKPGLQMGISVATSGAVGAAYAAVPQGPWSLLGAMLTSAITGTASLFVENADAKCTLWAVSTGAAGGALALESAKATGEMLAQRAAKKMQPPGAPPPSAKA